MDNNSLSLMRASSVVSRRSVSIASALPHFCREVPRGSFLAQGPMVEHASVRTLAPQDTDLHFLRAQPTAILLRVTELELFQKCASPANWGNAFLERGRLVGVEIANDRDDTIGARKMGIGDVAREMSPIAAGVTNVHVDMTSAD